MAKLTSGPVTRRPALPWAGADGEPAEVVAAPDGLGGEPVVANVLFGATRGAGGGGAGALETGGAGLGAAVGGGGGAAEPDCVTWIWPSEYWLTGTGMDVGGAGVAVTEAQGVVCA